jgi:hypothetical protein
MARDVTELERTNPKEYIETYRYRSKAEGTRSRIKARNSYMRLRRRRRDPEAKFPNWDRKKLHWELPPEIQQAIRDAARVSVGVARLNESLAILIVANLRALNLMEHRYNQRVTFDKNEPVSLNPPLEIPERELVTVP